MLIIDSGVGGLSVLEKIHQVCPDRSLHYVMDDGFFPYGLKDDQQLLERLKLVCAKAIETLSPKLVVIACNTASTLALDELRACFDVPFVGVVPAIKVAAQQSTTGQIGLLATPATVKRPYIDDLIKNFASHCNVRRFGSDKLVLWAEQYLQGRQPDGLHTHLNDWLTNPVELSHVVLGCTHFPLLRPLFEQLWPHINWIDSGDAIARRVSSLTSEFKTETNPYSQLFWTSHREDQSSAAKYLETLLTLKQSQRIIV